MSNSITLHPTLGVNPRCVKCSNCGKTYQLVLLGVHNHIDVCDKCGMQHVGGAAKDRYGNAKCQKCGVSSIYISRRRLTEYEQLTFGLCDDCKTKANEFQAELKKLYEEHKAAFDAGAIFASCKRCNSLMILKGDSEFAQHVRKEHSVLASKPVVVEMDGCHLCPPAEGAKK